MTERVSPDETQGVRVTSVASTPSSLLDVASRDTLGELEFAEALNVVAGHAVGELGAARVRARRPGTGVDAIRHELHMVREMRDLLVRNDPFRPEAVADLAESVARLGVAGSVLEGAELAALGAALMSMRVVGGELKRIAASAPSAAALATDLPPRDLEREILRALEPDGTVRDDASPALKRARERVRETRARLVRLLEDLARRLEPADRSPDATVTVRSGRYVVPIRRDARSRFRGIVHGESGSGATLFVEPQDAVELGNDLSVSEAEASRAVLQVLRDLSERARAHRQRIAAGWEMCIAADDLYARARYAATVGGAEPTLAAVSPVPAVLPLMLREARHPLLLAEGVEVVPFDLQLGGDRCVLVISGPNTGGKSVLLKAVGLITALAYAGVIPPVGEGTTLPVFRRIVAVVGDHQSIAANLSTFSAHVQRLRDALAGADAASLVLVDEIASGTDPVEGAALAGALLLELVARRARTVVTTHLSQLKDLAARTAGMENASLAFDAENLAPTYRLLQGVPGRSYGLVIAGRLGVPSSVLRQAESLLPAEERSLDALLADVERRAQGLEERASELAGLEARLEAQREVLNELQQQLNDRERELAVQGVELERTGREQARAFLLEARKRVEEALGLARAAVTEATAREARRLVEAGVKHEAEALKKLDDAAKKKGWTVKSSRFPLPVSPEVDLRGLTAEEAETVLTSAVDHAVVGDLRRLRVIHGKGTGALRARVQQVLQGDSRIAAFRLGEASEGGTGVTIVELAP